MWTKSFNKEKYGFIYIWFDRKRKMYYIGSHWGHVDDRYVCSSNRMRDAYRRRKDDFKRKILTYVFTNRQDLLDMEQRWFDLVKRKDRYYNLHFDVKNPWWMDSDYGLTVRQKISKANKGKPKPSPSDETRVKMGAANKGKVLSEEHKERIAAPQRKTYTFISPDGQLITTQNLKLFCVENNLSPTNMCQLAKGTYKRVTYNGWRVCQS
ncbi:putative homing endonuclease [Sinorhizobium phage phiN3]|uniref:Putative homing endonuclease n=1 Tax=Sinorhizobium phage phiN3 TaxID=1647405 RepID=A0A0F6SJ35_9CAUD|nr:putative homing endonuclease [Sinorhizobium phage phiN3]AKF13513.1 putative homing endonuclease [Sinorhizobium phage phiN3]